MADAATTLHRIDAAADIFLLFSDIILGFGILPHFIGRGSDGRPAIKHVDPAKAHYVAPKFLKNVEMEAKFGSYTSRMGPHEQKVLWKWLNGLGKNQSAAFIVHAVMQVDCGASTAEDMVEVLKSFTHLPDDASRTARAISQHWMRANENDYPIVKIEKILGIEYKSLDDLLPELQKKMNDWHKNAEARRESPGRKVLNFLVKKPF